MGNKAIRAKPGYTQIKKILGASFGLRWATGAGIGSFRLFGWTIMRHFTFPYHAITQVKKQSFLFAGRFVRFEPYLPIGWIENSSLSSRQHF